jgi:formylglycine-generating enzyme required for sulfatase activity
MNVCTCPDKNDLNAYLLGTLDADSLHFVEDHLEACAACLDFVDCRAAGVNTVFSALRPSVAPLVHDPALDYLVQKVKGFQAAVKEAAPAEGLVLGNYVLQERIGAGGMGCVYKAEHVRMKRLVAVKLLSPDIIPSPEARARFQREVEAAARLSSPHIVAAFDAGEAGGHDYLVMEYIEGCNLAEVVQRQGPLPMPLAMNYVVQAARGLAHAHAAGIVHRDIKPANLLRDSLGTVKVLDMGLARVQELPMSGKGYLTGAATVMGTAAFMAPEQAADTRAADHRADIYSLGCTFFYLLTGQALYEGQTTMETLIAHRERPIPSLREFRPDCPPEVDSWFRTLVAKRPEQRPQTMEAVISDLERLSAHHKKLPRRAWLAGTLVALAACLLLAVAFQGEQPETKDGRQITATNGRVIPVTNHKAPLIDMVAVEPGEFWMGASEGDPDAGDDEKPRRKIKITLPFLLGKTKITQAQFEEVMGNNPSAFSAKGRFKKSVEGKDTSLHPVESISWLDAIRFCNRLNERHDLEPYYQIEGTTVTVRGGQGYRLPTEAEWEFACRAGTSARWYFGENPEELDRHAWFASNSDETTHPVGKKKANPLGLFDMVGNVSEWCWDRYDSTYYKRMPQSDPPGSSQGDTRVHRGGAWNVLPAQTRSSAREARGFTYAVLTIVGMRVARNAE